MHLSATALIALLQAADVGTLIEAAPLSAPASANDRASATVTSMSSPSAPQGKAGGGSARRAIAA